MNDEVLLDCKLGVATVTLNRPTRLNAITSTMKSELLKIVTDLSRDKDLRCLVLTGAGRAFCAGADRAELVSRGEQDALTTLRQIETTQAIGEQLSRLPAITVAKVNGVVAGGGLGLALACDVTVASDQADVVFSFLTNNLVPDAGLIIALCATLGTRSARQLMLTREGLTAAEATGWGLFGEMTTAEALDARVGQIVDRIGHSSPLALAMTKRLYSTHRDLDLTAEALAQTIAIAHERKHPC